MRVDALLLPDSAGAVACLMLDPWKQQVLKEQLPAFWRVAVSAGSFIVVSLLLTVFALVYIVSTFTVCRCANSRRLLRLCDIRRDTHRKFGAVGTSTQSAPSTAGGCSLVLILSFALLKVVLDVAAGMDPNTCSVAKVDAESANTLRTEEMSSFVGVPPELGFTHATYFFFFRILDVNGNRANSSWTKQQSDSAVSFTKAVARDWWEAHGRQHFPARWREQITTQVITANGGALVEVYTPVTNGFTLFARPKGPTNQPLYALSNDCLDLALIKRQAPRFSGFGRCTSVVRYTKKVEGGQWFSNLQKSQFATPRPFETVTSASDTDMAVRAHYTKVRAAPSRPRFRANHVNATMPAVLTVEWCLHCEQDVPFCTTIGFAAGTPLTQSSRNSSTGLFSQLNMEQIMIANQLSSVATHVSCASGMELPATLQPQDLQSRLYRPLPASSPPTFVDKAFPTAILPDPELDVYPACAYAHGGASDVVQRPVGAAQNSPLRSTLGNVSYQSIADLAYTAGGVHRHYVGFPAGSGTLASTVFRLNVACPSIASTLMGSLSGVGGLLVFHPFLRLFLLQFRKRTGMPSAARHMADARDMRLSLGDARAAGRGALSTVKRMQVNQASGCLRRAKHGGISLHPTIRAIVTGTVVFICLAAAAVGTYLAAMSSITSAALGEEAAGVCAIIALALFLLSLLFVVVYGSVNVLFLCGPALRTLLVSPHATLASKGVMVVTAGGLCVWCMASLIQMSGVFGEVPHLNISTVAGALRFLVLMFAVSLVGVCVCGPCLFCCRKRCRRLLLRPSDFEPKLRDSDDEEDSNGQRSAVGEGRNALQPANAADKQKPTRADEEAVTHVATSSVAAAATKQSSFCMRLNVVCCRGGSVSTLWRGMQASQDSPFTMNPTAGVELREYK